MSLPLNQIICGDCRKILKTFPSESIDLVVFSPPYYGLRDYGKEANTIWGGDPNCEHEWEGFVRKGVSGGTKSEKVHIKGKDNFQIVPDSEQAICTKCGAWKGQLGLEPSWQMYIEHMVEIIREIKRVLKKTGSMWIVMGDTYKDKNLLGIPWRLAFALEDDGWTRRNAIIWHKPNHLPSSIQDRFTNTYEYIFFFTKVKKGYYFDLDKVRKPYKSVEGMLKYYSKNPIEKAKRFRRRESLFQIVPAEAPHRGSKDVIGRYERKLETKKLERIIQKLHEANRLIRDSEPEESVKEKRKEELVSKLHEIAKQLRGDVNPQGKSAVLDGWDGLFSNRHAHYKALKVLEQQETLTKEEKSFLLDYIQKHVGHPLGKNPGDVILSDSKFLKYDTKTASPAGRAMRATLEGKLTTHVMKKLYDVGSYLKSKLKESGYTIEELSEITGIKKTTLEHYFRTDLQGQALPSREAWEALKPLLNLGNYEDFITEEIKNVLPSPHPLGKNPGDYWEINTRPLKEAHFAPFPIDIPLLPILSACPPDGVVLDPMCGSGTTMVTVELINHGMWEEFKVPVNEIAKKTKWNLKWIGIEIVPSYVEIAKKRLAQFITKEKLTKFIEVSHL